MVSEDLLMDRGDHLVEVENLVMYFPVTAGVLRRKIADVKAVDGISFHMRRSETLGLVGESGCGKTTTGRCILRLYEITNGRIFFEGRDIVKLKSREMRKSERGHSLIIDS